jgi:hexose-6-phosphate dehydrogenase
LRDDLVDSIAADVLFQARACVQRFGDFHLALSSGPVLEGLYRRLMYDPNFRDLPWKRTHLWLAHETMSTNPQAPGDTYALVHDLIVHHSDIPLSQVHPIDARDPDAHLRYEQALKDVLEWREKGHDRLDCVLLTLSPPGGVAGLAPDCPSVDEEACMVTRCGHDREGVTLTPRLLNASRFVGIVAAGEEVRESVTRLEARASTAADLPAVAINPVGGELRWYLDSEACPD